MSTRLLTGAGVWVVLTVGTFLLDPVLGTAVLVFGGILVVIGYFSTTWGDAPSYAERELARSRRRAVAREANSGKRDKDRARYQAGLARKAAREARKSA